MIKGLHHNAHRCRDSQQTRQFYEAVQPAINNARGLLDSWQARK